jgi:homoserine kinase
MVTVRVPGSTSNLGPGFDTLGLALGLYVEVSAEVCDGPDDEGACIEVEGEGVAELPRTRENLVYRAYRLAASREGIEPPPLRLRVRSDIPLARGLGSSAAAAVAGISIFEVVTKRWLSLDRVLELGFEMEGHCDNFAASVLGGLVTACTPAGRPPIAVSTTWPLELRAVLVIPNVHMRTSAARGILPRTVLREDAIFNVQRVALLHAALRERRWDLLRDAMRDRLHQPYRASLVPGLEDVFALEPDGPLLGVAMSGAGSAVIALAVSDFEAVGERIARCFAAHNVETSVKVLDVDTRGRTIVDEAGR